MAQPWYTTVSLTDEQEQKVAQLKEAVGSIVTASPAHIAFCTRGTYIRYLRARSWNLAKATKMLLETLKWRAEYQPHALNWDNLKHEGTKGKLFILDQPDKAGRPVVLMRPRLEAVYSGASDERVKWLVYSLEQAARIADMSAGDGKMTWLIDYIGYNSKNSPPIKVSLQVLSILQNHFPERLGCAVSYHPPTLFNILWRAVSPFIDPLTREKLVFLSAKSSPEEMEKHFDLGNLDECLGGALPDGKLWSYEGYEKRMQALDAAAAAAVEQAGKESAVLSAEDQALNAEFEKHVVVI